MTKSFVTKEDKIFHFPKLCFIADYCNFRLVMRFLMWSRKDVCICRRC